MGGGEDARRWTAGAFPFLTDVTGVGAGGTRVDGPRLGVGVFGERGGAERLTEREGPVLEATGVDGVLAATRSRNAAIFAISFWALANWSSYSGSQAETMC